MYCESCGSSGGKCQVTNSGARMSVCTRAHACANTYVRMRTHMRVKRARTSIQHSYRYKHENELSRMESIFNPYEREARCGTVSVFPLYTPMSPSFSLFLPFPLQSPRNALYPFVLPILLIKTPLLADFLDFFSAKVWSVR